MLLFTASWFLLTPAFAVVFHLLVVFPYEEFRWFVFFQLLFNQLKTQIGISFTRVTCPRGRQYGNSDMGVEHSRAVPILYFHF